MTAIARPSLTEKQARTYAAIRDALEQNGRAPTMAELGRTAGISRVSVFEHVEALIAKGYLVRTSPNKARCLALGPRSMATPLRLAAEQAVAAGRLSASGEDIVLPRRFMLALAVALEDLGKGMDPATAARLAEVRPAPPTSEELARPAVAGAGCERGGAA